MMLGFHHYRAIWSSRRRAILLIGAGAAALFPAAAGGQEGSTIDRVLAVVGDEVITLGEFRQLRSASRPTVAPGLREWVDERLQLQAARREGISVTDDEVRRVAQQISPQEGDRAGDFDELRRQVLLAKVANRRLQGGNLLTEEEIIRNYEQNKVSMGAPPKVRLRQIFLAAGPDGRESPEARMEKALALRRRIVGGESFETLARLYSDGPEAVRGGLLGDVSPEELQPDLEQAIRPLRPGEITEPIVRPGGIHLLLVEDRLLSEPAPLETVRSRIETRVRQEKMNRSYEEWLAELRRKTTVEVRWDGRDF